MNTNTNETTNFNFEALPVKITYVGKVNDKAWPHYLWDVTITYSKPRAVGYFTTPYKTGLGLIKNVGKASLIMSKTNYGQHIPAVPTKKDILCALLNDATAADISFGDWCAESGYDDDKISALNVYKACCDTGMHLRKAFTREQLDAMREVLQDY